jgi:hypothetical protein
MKAKQLSMNGIGQGLQQSPQQLQGQAPGQTPSVNNLLGEYMNEI